MPVTLSFSPISADLITLFTRRAEKAKKMKFTNRLICFSVFFNELVFKKN